MHAAREAQLVRHHAVRHRGAALRRDEPPAQAPQAAPGQRRLAGAQRRHRGPVRPWWASWILNKEGEEHHRLRRLMNPAFSPKLIGGLVPALPGAGRRADRRLRRTRPLRVRLGVRRAVRRPGDRHHARPPRGGVADHRHGGGDDRAGPGRHPPEELPRIEARAGPALRLRRRPDRRPPREPARRLRHRAGQRLPRRRRPAVRRRAARRPGAAGLRRLRHHPQPARPGHADLPATTPTSGGCSPSGPSSGKAAVEEVMRVNPTVRWVTREVLEDFEYEGVATHRPAPRCTCYSESAGHRPPGLRRPASTSPRRPQAALRVRRRGAPLPGPLRRPLRHERGAARCWPAGCATRTPCDGATWLPDSGNTGPMRLPIGFTPRRLTHPPPNREDSP